MKHKSSKHRESRSPKRKSSKRRHSKSLGEEPSKSRKSRSPKRKHEEDPHKQHTDSSQHKDSNSGKRHKHTSRERDSLDKKRKHDRSRSESIKHKESSSRKRHKHSSKHNDSSEKKRKRDRSRSESSKHKDSSSRKKHKHSSKHKDSSEKRKKRDRSRSEKKSRSKEKCTNPSVKNEPTEMAAPEQNDNSILKKQRRSRWSANEFDKCVIPGMPTTLPANLKSDDAEVYVIQLQITDITNRLQKQNYTSEIEAMSRLPSPDPVYGHDGKRINTKEYRARERLEERRRQLMLKLHSLRPELVPQADKIGGRYEEKVYIPQEDHMEINLIGLIIGPRGLTLKELEKEFGVKIIIRGKGSVHNGKVNVNNSLPGEDEPLHAFVSSFSKDNVERAVNKINQIVSEGIQFPELENDLRKNQMKQLAILNGTYRETEGLNKLKMLSEAQTIATNTIICSLCGGTGHLPRDCKAHYDASIAQAAPTPQSTQLDGEYKSFMNELGPDAQITGMPGYLGFTSQEPLAPPGSVNSFVRKFVFNS